MKRNTAKILSLILLCAMLASFMSFSASAETPKWNGTPETTFAGGSGTAEKPYLIRTGGQLAYLANIVNAGEKTAGLYYKLDADIDLDNAYWTPIGNTLTMGFKGVFTGGGHTIRNLSVNITSSSNGYAGLFGNVFGEVSQFTIDGATVSGSYTDYELGVGAAVAVLSDKGLVCNVHVKNAKVSGRSNVGGVVGITLGTAKICSCSFEDSTVTYTGIMGCGAGGILGGTKAGWGDPVIVSGCWCSGSTITANGAYLRSAGGIVGAQCLGDNGWDRGINGHNLEVKNCYNSSEVNAPGTKQDVYAGGIVGYIDSRDRNDIYATVENCYNVGTVTAGTGAGTVNSVCHVSCAGGIVGCYHILTTTGVISNCYNGGTVKTTGTSGVSYALSGDIACPCYNAKNSASNTSTIRIAYCQYLKGCRTNTSHEIANGIAQGTQKNTAAELISVINDELTGVTPWIIKSGEYPTIATCHSVKGPACACSCGCHCVYIAPVYTVSFDANGGSGSMSPVSVSEGSQYALPSCGFTAPEGLQFSGWRIGSATYKVGDKITVTESVTAYAQWSKAKPTAAEVLAIDDAIVLVGADGTSPIKGVEGKDFKIGEVVKNDDGSYSCTVELVTGDQYAPEGYDFDEFGKDTVELVYDPETDTWKLAEDGQGIAKVSPEPPDKPGVEDFGDLDDAVSLIGADGTSPIKGVPGEDYTVGEVTPNDDGTYSCVVTLDPDSDDLYAPEGFEGDGFEDNTVELIYDPATGEWSVKDDANVKVKPAKPSEDDVKAIEDAVVIVGATDGTSEILGNTPIDFEIGEVTQDENGNYVCEITLKNGDLYAPEGYDFDNFEKDTVELVFDPETGAWELAENGQGKAVVSPSAPDEDAVKALEDAVIINDDPDGESKKGILGSAPEDFEIGEVTKNDDGSFSCVVTITNPDLYPEDGHEVDEFEKPTVELIFDPETGAWRIAEGGEAVLNTKLSASEVTVTFVVPTHTNAVFGEVAPMVVTVPTGSYVEITLPAAPENTGEWVYVFRGWHAEGDEEGTWRKPGTTYKVTGNVTLTAVWRLASLTGDKTWNFRDAMAIMDHIDNSKEYTFCAEQLEIANFDLDAKNTINFRDSMAIMSFAEGTIPFPFSDDNPPKD